MAFLQKKGRFDPPWLSISDMMTILMFIFLLSVIRLRKENDIAEVRLNIKNMLTSQFSPKELQSWDATINLKNGDISIRSIDFDSGKFTLKPHHKVVLDDFFPKYIQALSQFSNDIIDIKIEGHTDTDGAYLMNLRLSQDRSREVLSYLIQANPIWESQNPWFFKKLSASGRSESQIIFTNSLLETSYGIKKEGFAEDKTQSRRVVFRFILREANFSATDNTPAEGDSPTNTRTSPLSDTSRFSPAKAPLAPEREAIIPIIAPSQTSKTNPEQEVLPIESNKISEQTPDKEDDETPTQTPDGDDDTPKKKKNKKAKSKK